MQDLKKDMTFGEYLEDSSKNCLIIYLDILGYKDYFSRIDERELFTSVEKMWMGASGFLRPGFKNEGHSLKWDHGIKMYSDNILLYSKLEDDEFDSLRCTTLLSLTAFFQFYCLEECMVFLRGAITDGKCCIGDYIFGKPFMIVHDMESKKAGWSRIVVSDDTVKKYIPSSIESAIIKRDSDGIFFIDYLTHLIFMKFGSPEKILKKHRNAVIATARRTLDIERLTKPHSLYDMGELQTITKKLRQVTKYHNDTCDAYGISEKIEEVESNNTFLQDYENFVYLFHHAGIDRVDDLEDALTKLTITYRQVTDSIRHNKKKLDEIEEELKKRNRVSGI